MLTLHINATVFGCYTRVSCSFIKLKANILTFFKKQLDTLLKTKLNGKSLYESDSVKSWHYTMEFSINSFFSNYDQIHSFLWIWSHLLKNPLWKPLFFVWCREFLLTWTCGGNMFYFFCLGSKQKNNNKNDISFKRVLSIRIITFVNQNS